MASFNSARVVVLTARLVHACPISRTEGSQALFRLVQTLWLVVALPTRLAHVLITRVSSAQVNSARVAVIALVHKAALWLAIQNITVVLCACVVVIASWSNNLAFTSGKANHLGAWV